MKYIDEYRDSSLISKLSDQIRKEAKGEYRFMEVCGGHTAAIHRFGIPSILPPQVELLSGPGCPVCVTPTGFIDKILKYSESPDVTIASFGDLLRVPGTSSSLAKVKEEGADVRIVVSALDALSIAAGNPAKRVIFPAIGFETTAPGTAVTIRQARQDNIRNFFTLSGHKIMPPAMEAIILDGVRLNGFICPGHVSAITGSGIFDFIPEKFGIGCVVTGFEPADLLQSVLMLIRQVNNNSPVVEIQYRRAVSQGGNLLARKNLDEVFESGDAYWRGLGEIKNSGLMPREQYMRFDIGNLLPLNIEECSRNEHCICGSILRGLNSPSECSLFAKTCTPENPVGACMVSPEGACNAWYKYHSVNA